MNHKLISFVALIALAGTMFANSEVTPTYVVRSQGSDAARKLVGVSDKVHLSDEGRNVNFTALLEYARSFRDEKIARCMFGTDLVNDNQRILIQGTGVENRNANAWLADYFYLAPDYDSYFDIKPTIQNVVVDLDLYAALDDMLEGLYIRIHGPLNWTRWNLNFEEPCDVETTNSYIAGYFDHQAMENNRLLQSFGSYAQGNSPLNTEGTSDQPGIGVKFCGLEYAQIDRCEHSRTGFADLRFELGYNMVRGDDYHFGLNVQVAAPTGNRTCARLAFDPTVGNRNHWEVGGGLTAHYNFYNNDKGTLGLFLDFNLTHVNRAREERTFDLCNRPNSRYMLAHKMGLPVNFLRAGDSTSSAGNTTIPIKQFKSVFTPVANLTTLNIPVSIAVQADLALMLSYQYKQWSFDLGYNLYARSCENFGNPREYEQCCPSLCDGSKHQWALKGDAHVFGFLADNSGSGSGSLSQFDPVALSATQCGATIHSGTNAGVEDDDTCTGVNTLQNCGVDNAKFAFGRGTASNSTDQFLVHSPNGPTNATDAIKTSLEPLFIDCCDINLQRTRGLSNKLFLHANYTWERNSVTPYLGLGGFVEFGRNEDACCTPLTVNCDQDCDNTSCEPQCCTDCLDCSLSQWGVWIKGGVNFQ